jgi:hypothetical protein
MSMSTMNTRYLSSAVDLYSSNSRRRSDSRSGLTAFRAESWFARLRGTDTVLSILYGHGEKIISGAVTVDPSGRRMQLDSLPH